MSLWCHLRLGDDGPDVLVCVGGGVRHQARKASTSSRKLATATIPPTRKPSQWRRGFPAKSNTPSQPSTQVIHWVRWCEQRTWQQAPQLPALLREGNSSQPARQLSGFVYGNWPSLSSYSQGGVLPKEGMSGAERHTPRVTSTSLGSSTY